MTCKKCGIAVSPVIVAESTKKIGAICHGLGMPDETSRYVVNQQGPLCRKCLQNWGADEDDLSAPPPY